MAQPQKTFEEIKAILSKVSYKDWELRVIEKHPDTILCQWVFYAPDNDMVNDLMDVGGLELEIGDLPKVPQFCRKWYISCFSTESEVIRDAYKAVVEAERHEIDENFLYAGIRLFDPHTNLPELAQYMEQAEQDVRIDKDKK